LRKADLSLPAALLEPWVRQRPAWLALNLSFPPSRNRWHYRVAWLPRVRSPPLPRNSREASQLVALFRSLVVERFYPALLEQARRSSTFHPREEPAEGSSDFQEVAI